MSWKFLRSVMALFVKVLVIPLFSAVLGKKQERLPQYPLYQSNRSYMAYHYEITILPRIRGSKGEVGRF